MHADKAFAVSSLALARVRRAGAVLVMPSRLVAIGLPLAHFGTIFLSYRLHLTSLWMVNAILLAALIRHRVAVWPALLLLTGIADAAAWFAVIGPAPTIAVSIAADLLIPLLVAAALHRFADNGSWFFSIRWMILFAQFSIAAMALVIPFMLGAGALMTDSPSSLAAAATRWSRMVVTGSLGVILATPLILSWTEPALRQRFSVRQLVETLGLSCAVAAISYYTFTSPLPLLFLVFPFLALLTLRGGLMGATAGAITLTVVGAWFTARNMGPFAGPHLDDAQSILFVQAYFLTAIFSTLPLAVILALRESVTERLAREHAIAGAALNNMVQGLCMFDASHRLIVCNARYADLYSLPDHLIVPGTPCDAILDYQRRAAAQAGRAQACLGHTLADAEGGCPHSEAELPSGRIISINRRRLEGGGWVSTHEDVTESRLAAKRITYLANHDPLTDLPNRACFREQLHRSIALAERGHGFALLCLDLDRFKEVNDTLGHAAGDELLKQVAGRLQKAVRETDLVTRLGGDEFAVLQFPLERPEEAGTLAARIVARLSEPYEIHGHEANIGASVGIALAPADSLEPDDLLQKSDLALYRAKLEGRGTFRFFEAGMDNALRARRMLEGQLRTAIQEGQFELYYQPILDLESGAVDSFEALIRWHHPTRGIVLPDEFIGVAEESGLIVPIGDWVIRQACREAAGWPENVRVAVNLSPAQFKNRGLVATVTNALAGARLAPPRLELELTESVLLQDSDSVLATLERLRRLGVVLAMDDFGTGYSSLSYLRNFSFDKIKIDQSFIRDLGTADSLAIVSATVQLSSKLGMRTTAEGVETAEQLAALQANGCTNVQGYFVGRPLPARHALAVINQHAGHGPVRLRKSG